MLANLIIDEGIVLLAALLGCQALIVLKKFKVRVLHQFDVFEDSGPVIVEV